MNSYLKTTLSDINFFGITNEELLDKNKVKVITGIAGSAKSSNIDKIFNDFGIEYARFTSTNKLKNDAEIRYEKKSFTIAGGLFTSKNGKFFIDKKEINYKHIVIDEILQTSKRVLDWIDENVGKINIIICTDENQMLVPHTGEYLLQCFKEFQKKDYVINIELSKTYRARNKETEELYYDLYNNVNSYENMFCKYKNDFKIINFNVMPFNKNDIYICHTNQIEEMLYNEKNISNRRDLNYILKGSIASKQIKDINKYPILCQNQIKKNMIAYLQPANIASATRYQGSEVNNEQKLYYLVERKSFITNREFYTVLSRCYNKESLIIVLCEIKEEDNLTTFFNCNVKNHKIASVNGDYVLSDGLKLEDAIKEKTGKKLLISSDDFKNIKQTIKEQEGVYFDDEFIECDGTIISSGKGDEYCEKQNEIKKGKFTVRSLLKKEGQFDYNFCTELYRILESHSIENIKYAISSNYSHTAKNKCNYYIDLFSAYPHILDSQKLPVKGKIYYEYDKDKMNFFLYKGGETDKETYITKNAIITDDMKDFLSKFKNQNIEYLFSTDYTIGCEMGHFLHGKAHKSKETKEEVSGMHYGFLQKQYLKPIYKTVAYYDVEDNNKIGCNRFLGYSVLNKNNKYEILMIAILSQLTYILLSLQYHIYNGFDKGTIIIDALHFFTKEDAKTYNINDVIVKINEYMKENFNIFDYRIAEKIFDIDNKPIDKKVVYKTYDDLKTKKELDAERKRLARQKAKINQNKNK